MPPESNKELYLSPRTAATRLDMSVGAFQRWCRAGRVPGARRLGRGWRIPESALLKLLGDPVENQATDSEDRIVIATGIIDSAIRRADTNRKNGG